MHTSPLHSFHVELGARMVDFGGWQMPLMYRGIIEEHNHTRNACSVFDVSHMGRLHIGGRDAEPFLQHICTRNLAGMAPGLSRYSHICREDGGILDDVIVSRHEDSFGIVCNAGNRERVLAWLGKHAQGRTVTIEDRTQRTAMIAVQGPKAMSETQRLLKVDLSDLKRYRFKKQIIMTFPCFFYRSGYTGEDGVEIDLPVNLAKLALPALLELAGDEEALLRPAGLGARDTLRLEAAMPLYGHELTEQWDSLSAGQGWCIDLDKDFVGAAAMRKLRDQGLRQRIVGLELEGKRTARQHFVVRAGGEAIGEVTSGALSPTLGKSIAMAMVAEPHTEPGTDLTVDFAARQISATVVALPFYKR